MKTDGANKSSVDREIEMKRKVRSDVRRVSTVKSRHNRSRERYWNGGVAAGEGGGRRRGGGRNSERTEDLQVFKVCRGKGHKGQDMESEEEM